MKVAILSNEDETVTGIVHKLRKEGWSPTHYRTINDAVRGLRITGASDYGTTPLFEVVVFVWNETFSETELLKSWSLTGHRILVCSREMETVMKEIRELTHFLHTGIEPDGTIPNLVDCVALLGRPRQSTAGGWKLEKAKKPVAW